MPVTIDEIIVDAMTSNHIPKINFDGFVNGVVAADILLVLQQHAQSVAVLNMSLATAGNLAKHLNDLILASENALNTNNLTPIDFDMPINKKEEIRLNQLGKP